MKRIHYFLILVFLISTLVYLYNVFKPVTMITYLGEPFYFRDDINTAKKISVYPDENIVHDMFWNDDVKNITVLFKPLDKGNQYYAVENFELTYKLLKMYQLNGHKKYFNEAEPISSYDNIETNDKLLKIVLVAPAFTNATYVEGKDNIIYIHAKDYRDFDLATIKTILVAMNINSS